jgi:hypothetical protein
VTTDSKGEKILLLVGDDVKSVVVERLTSDGFVIGAVSSDADAIARISEEEFVVAIVDLGMAAVKNTCGVTMSTGMVLAIPPGSRERTFRLGRESSAPQKSMMPSRRHDRTRRLWSRKKRWCRCGACQGLRWIRRW